MKKCNKCKIKKELSEFKPHKTMKDGFTNKCKSCIAVDALSKRKTKKGLVRSIYSSQRSSSKTRGHSMPTYTLDELRQWFNNHPLANALYDAWRLSGYAKNLRPSVDRLDDSKGYSMDNIQLMTWGENDAKAKADRRNGRNEATLKAVVQMTMDNVFVAEHHSISKASRVIGVSAMAISLCVNGKTNSSGGYCWSYR